MGKHPKWLGICSGVLLAVGCGPPPQPVPSVQSVQEIYEAEGGALDPLPTMPELKAYTEVKGFPEYLIGPDGILEIALRDVIVTKETATVRPDGNISFSLAENVRAAGRTTTELDSVLTAELARFLREPKVDIQVSESETQTKAVPMLSKKFALEACGLVDMVARLVINPNSGERELRFAGNQEFLAKTRVHVVNPVEPPDLTMLYRKIFGIKAPKDEAEPKDESKGDGNKGESRKSQSPS